MLGYSFDTFEVKHASGRLVGTEGQNAFHEWLRTHGSVHSPVFAEKYADEYGPFLISLRKGMYIRPIGSHVYRHENTSPCIVDMNTPTIGRRQCRGEVQNTIKICI